MTACGRCAAPCCRHYYVSLEGHEVRRLARELSLPPADFVSLRWLEQADSDCRIILEGDAPREERRYYGLALRKVPDAHPQIPWRCVFLVETETRGRCGAYPWRPMVCRLYPTSFYNGVVGTDGGGRFCPPRAWQLGHIHVEEARANWQLFFSQRALFREIIDGWNERVLAYREVRDEGALGDYILRVYDAILEREPDVLDEPLASWTVERMRGLVDVVLRALGWRSDETLRAAEPGLGMEAPQILLLRGKESALILDPDEEIDPVGAAMAKRMGIDRRSRCGVKAR